MNTSELRVWEVVVARDRGVCQWPGCTRRGAHVHHIIPRSHFGKRGHAVCWQAQNMVCLCVGHHEQAHTRASRILLFGVLASKHGYGYEGKPYSEYVSK